MPTTTTAVCKWPVLFAAVFLTLLIPPAFGQTNSVPPESATPQAKLLEFEVASIKQNKSPTDQFRMHFTQDGLEVENASLLMIIRGAYGMFNSLDDKFIGVPSWAKQDKFNLEAKVDPADAPAFQKLDFDHRWQMLRALLADRFQLQTHPEMREQPVYALVVARTGSKLSPAAISENADPGGTFQRRAGQITAKNIVISQFISALTQTLGRTVLDKTELAGKYDLNLTWTPDAAEGSSMAPKDPSLPEASGPSIFTAIQEQLGLKLEPTKAPVPVIVIEHLERPSAN